MLDPAGELRSPTEAASTDGSRWVLRFDPPLGGGAVGVKWMVKAPDAHPIEGSFSFTITAPAPGVAAAERPAPTTPDITATAPDFEAFLDTSGDPTTTAKRVGAAARVLTLTGTPVGIGALVFAAAVVRGDHRDVARAALGSSGRRSRRRRRER